jgi:hypothetical protein
MEDAPGQAGTHPMARLVSLKLPRRTGVGKTGSWPWGRRKPGSVLDLLDFWEPINLGVFKILADYRLVDLMAAGGEGSDLARAIR